MGIKCCKSEQEPQDITINKLEEKDEKTNQGQNIVKNNYNNIITTNPQITNLEITTPLPNNSGLNSVQLSNLSPNLTHSREISSNEFNDISKFKTEDYQNIKTDNQINPQDNIQSSNIIEGLNIDNLFQQKGHQTEVDQEVEKLMNQYKDENKGGDGKTNYDDIINNKINIQTNDSKLDIDEILKKANENQGNNNNVDDKNLEQGKNEQNNIDKNLDKILNVQNNNNLTDDNNNNFTDINNLNQNNNGNQEPLYFSQENNANNQFDFGTPIEPGYDFILLNNPETTNI